MSCHAPDAGGHRFAIVGIGCRLAGGRGGSIDGLDEFDPAFFGIDPDAWKVEDDRQLRALLGRQSRLIHVYGATEATIEGAGVAAGYLGNPDATAARFMTVEIDERGPMRLYRTGDIARWDTRGTLHAVARPAAGAATRPPARKG